MFGAVFTFRLMLFPLAPNVPSTKTLMAGIVTCKVAVLLKALLFVATRDKVYLLIITHVDQKANLGMSLKLHHQSALHQILCGQVNVR